MLQLQCVAASCSELQGAGCGSAEILIMCCSVLQCVAVAVCYSKL